MSSLPYWVAIAHIPDLGPKGFKRLLEIFASPEEVLAASPETLLEAGVLTPTQIDRLQRRGQRLDEIEAEISAWTEDGIQLLTWVDDAYPLLLHTISTPPPLLYVRGEIRPEDHRAVAIVGTRAPTPEGAEAARILAASLAREGVTIVSGLAEGIDTAAHLGALEAGGRTLAIVGCGLLQIGPPESACLAEEIVGNGAVISEVAPYTRMRTALLMARNRLQSGLSRAVIVVQTRTRGGSLATARNARQQKRLLFTCVWPPDIEASEGNAQLIDQGAIPLADPLDPTPILQAIASWTPPSPQEIEESDQLVLKGLGRRMEN